MCVYSAKHSSALLLRNISYGGFTNECGVEENKIEIWHYRYVALNLPKIQEIFMNVSGINREIYMHIYSTLKIQELYCRL